jgi:tryptophanyl-tRNA synthetase
MQRVLTGIQASGKPHLGNLLGAIEPAIQLSKVANRESFLFIADLHSLTTIKNPAIMQDNTYAVAAAWLASGFDYKQNFIYRQSRLAGFHTELMWYLNCLTPFPMLANATSFKDKSENLADVNAGLFTYPVLQAADILLYQSHLIPVGKDQSQHIEMTREIGGKFNRTFGENFVLPEAVINPDVMTIPGTDGRKMSKSLNNYIDVFLNEKDLMKQIKGIISDSKLLEDPKDPETDVTFKIFSVVASESEVEELKEKYLAGNFGYGHAKKALFEVIWTRFEKQRVLYNQYMNDLPELDKILKEGESRAFLIAQETISKVRMALGYA